MKRRLTIAASAFAVMFLFPDIGVSENEQSKLTHARIGIGLEFVFSSDGAVSLGDFIPSRGADWAESLRHEDVDLCQSPGRILSLDGDDPNNSEIVDRSLWALALQGKQVNMTCSKFGRERNFLFDPIIEAGDDGGNWYVITPSDAYLNRNIHTKMEMFQSIGRLGSLEWRPANISDGVSIFNKEGAELYTVAVVGGTLLAAIYARNVDAQDTYMDLVDEFALTAQVPKDKAGPNDLYPVVIGLEKVNPKTFFRDLQKIYEQAFRLYLAHFDYELMSLGEFVDEMEGRNTQRTHAERVREAVRQNRKGLD